MYKVGVYIRLSKEDKNKKYLESESIINQRNIILKYLKDNNLDNYTEYIDDGYSGTNFERPGFQNLLKDIENKKVNMVVTKDMSRLGRNYLKTGYYIEEYFPIKKVRYVSILDNIDTSLDSNMNDIAPFRSLFNDLVSKDTSKKIKSVLKNKKREGLFLGQAPFGYKKSKSNKYKLIYDLKVKFIVEEIFSLFLNNFTIKEIVEVLNDKKYITPSKYKKLKRYSEVWTSSMVYSILKNEEYTGCTIQNVYPKINYKSKKRYRTIYEDRIKIENTHQKIISKEDFFDVQKLLGK